MAHPPGSEVPDVLAVGLEPAAVEAGGFARRGFSVAAHPGVAWVQIFDLELASPGPVGRDSRDGVAAGPWSQSWLRKMNSERSTRPAWKSTELPTPRGSVIESGFELDWGSRETLAGHQRCAVMVLLPSNAAALLPRSPAVKVFRPSGRIWPNRSPRF